MLWGSVVEHGTRLPLFGAAVSLAPGPGGTVGLGTRVTDAEGRFRFDVVPPGTYILVVELLGYHTRRDTLHVEAATHLEALLPLSTTPIPLEAIVVVADVRRPWFLEEAERRARGRGATLLTREDIEARAALYFTDLLRTVAGVSVAPSRRGALVRMRGGCRPDIIVDGIRTVPDMPLDDILRPDDVELVEVYPGVNAPPEYSNSPCGAILVWTRRGDPVGPKGGFWKRLALALTFLTLGYFLTR